ncbi:Cytochrome-c peroxidase, partial [Plesiocystis pacifica SIR-1]
MAAARRLAWLSLGVFSACAEPEPEADRERELRALLELPEHFELPAIPESNPLTAEKIALGRRLFYDRDLSGNGTQSCADCHLQELAFSDGLETPTGSTGTVLARNSQGLANVAYNASLTWASDG